MRLGHIGEKSGGEVKLQWLCDEFTVVPAYLEDMEVEQFASAYILHMFGTLYFYIPPQIRYTAGCYLS